jgi:hypothetical protein
MVSAADAVHPVRDTNAALAYAARASGGAVLGSAGELGPALAAIAPGPVDITGHPMRSPWWMAPFTLLLCAEWTLRRRAGLK